MERSGSMWARKQGLLRTMRIPAVVSWVVVPGEASRWDWKTDAEESGTQGRLV